MWLRAVVACVAVCASLCSSLEWLDDVDDLLGSKVVRLVPGQGAAVSLSNLVAPLLGADWVEPYASLKRDAGVSWRDDPQAASQVMEMLASDERLSVVLRLEELAADPRVEALEALVPGLWASEVKFGTAHVYASSARSAALANHTDPSDILVVQLHGEKDWLVCSSVKKHDKVFEPKLETCATYDSHEMSERECETMRLTPGDTLFVPRRTVHSARATEKGASVHITFEIRDDSGAYFHPALEDHDMTYYNHDDESSCWPDELSSLDDPEHEGLFEFDDLNYLSLLRLFDGERQYRHAMDFPQVPLSEAVMSARLISRQQDFCTEESCGEQEQEMLYSVQVTPNVIGAWRNSLLLGEPVRRILQTREEAVLVYDDAGLYSVELGFSASDYQTAIRNEAFHLTDCPKALEALVGVEDLSSLFPGIADSTCEAFFGVAPAALEAADRAVVTLVRHLDEIGVGTFQGQFNSSLGRALKAWKKDGEKTSPVQGVAAKISACSEQDATVERDVRVVAGENPRIEIVMDWTNYNKATNTRVFDCAREGGAITRRQFNEVREVIQKVSRGRFQRFAVVFGLSEADGVTVTGEVELNGRQRRLELLRTHVRRRLASTNFRTGNACNAGTASGSGSYTCGSCNQACDNCFMSDNRELCYEYSCDSNCQACSTCLPCEPGQFQLEEGATTCESCVRGKFAPLQGAPECQLCLRGKYAQFPGACSCTPCAPGSFADEEESSICLLCPSGRYQDELSKSDCKECTAGFYCPEGAEAEIPCAPGKYSSQGLAPSCDDCDDGKYSPLSVQLPTTIDPEDGITECGPCGAGFYPSVTAGFCIPAEAGTYSEGGQELPTECPAGSFCVTAAETYDVCPAGKWSLAGASSCESCVPGRYLADDVSGDDAAELLAHSAQAKCLVCGAGVFSAVPASSQCEQCDAGKFLADDAMLDEAEHDEEADCLACDEGRASNAGASQCEQCDAGRFASGVGNAACPICAAGRYQSDVGQSGCLGCESGRYNDDLASDPLLHDSALDDCTLCTGGRFAETDGSTDCEDCEAGRSGPGTGNSACSVCAAGRVSAKGAAFCENCPEGEYLEDDGLNAANHDLNDCSLCPESLFCAGGGCAICTSCATCELTNTPPTCASLTLAYGPYDENTGTLVLENLGCSDVDNDFLSYTITAGDDDSMFGTIGGVLRVVQDGGLNFEKRESYVLTIKVKEENTDDLFELILTVNITVNDLNDVIVTGATPDVLGVRGSELITLTGENLGPYTTSASFDALNPPVVTATYSNGADGAVYYAYDCSVTVPGTEVQCYSDEGVGQLHEWMLTIATPGLTTWMGTGSFTTSYEVPTLDAVVSDSGIGLSTPGLDSVTVTGSGFGPYCTLYCAIGEKACGSTCVDVTAECLLPPTEGAGGVYACGWWLEQTITVTYGRALATIEEFRCALATSDIAEFGVNEAYVTTNITCTTGEGYAVVPFWAVTVGVPNAASMYVHTTPERIAVISYAAPTIESVEVDDTALTTSTLPTTGGSTVRLLGYNFGVADSVVYVTATYGGANGDLYAFEGDCVIIADHTEVRCVTTQGVGTLHQIKATRAALTSELSVVSVSYAAPSVDGASGSLADSPTRGDGAVYLTGSNFGPTSTLPMMSYGPLPGADLYSSPSTCAVVVAHTKARCTTGPGTGSMHDVKITVEGQTSEPYAAGLSYAKPFVINYESFYSGEDRDGFLTVGGERILINGGNFGLLDATIDLVTHGPEGVEYTACDGTSCECEISVDHDQIDCTTVLATGKAHIWKVNIDGQESTTPTTKTQRPSIDLVVAAGVFGSSGSEDGFYNASLAGEELFSLFGSDFGHQESKLESVTYGPSGDEFVARNCTLINDGKIECRTAPGAGFNNVFVVTVDGQVSDFGGVLSYARPRILGVNGVSGPTKGGIDVFIDGINLGLGYGAADIKIVWGPASLIVERDRFAPCDADPNFECVYFRLPELTGSVHSTSLFLRLGSVVHPAISLDSNSVFFEYEEPFITSFSTSDGALGGTTEVVINGRNFGANKDVGSVYVGSTKQTLIESYTHERILLIYLAGTSGSLTVQLGEKESNSIDFGARSPRLVTDDPRYLPPATLAGAYHTSGLDEFGVQRVITIVGYRFNGDQEGDMEAWVGTEEVLVGADIRFGTQAVITAFDVNSAVTDLPNPSASPDDIARELTFEIPEYYGASQVITIWSQGRASFTGEETDLLYISYKPPTITALSPLFVSTQGGETVTIVGDDFGGSTADAIVTLGGIVCPQLETDRSHQMIKCVVQEGQGSDLVFRVDVGGQIIDLLPTINNIQGQIDALSTSTSVQPVGFSPPTVDSLTPPELPTTGGRLTIRGSNLGTDPEVTLKRGAVATFGVTIVFSNHTMIVCEVAAGQGRNTLELDIGGQKFTQTLAYIAPQLDDLTPSEATTLGGVPGVLNGTNLGIGSDYILAFERPGSPTYSTADGSLTVQEFGVTAIEFTTPTGEASGPMEVTLKVCGDAGNEATCVSSTEAPGYTPLIFNFSRATIHYVAVDAGDGLEPVFDSCYTELSGTAMCINATCDRTDACSGGGGCMLGTSGGTTIGLVGNNFGVSLPTVKFGELEVAASHQAGFSTHSYVFFELPVGVGLDVPVSVSVGGYDSEPALFAYDPPCISYVTPNTPDARGAVISIEGLNFGATSALAGDIEIRVGGVPCDPVVVGSELDKWQTVIQGDPYLYCETRASVVGPKSVEIFVADQNASYAADLLLLETHCGSGYYGQPQFEPYTTPLGECFDSCSEEAERCMQHFDFETATYAEESGCLDSMSQCVSTRLGSTDALANCTMITDQDEYCLSCPLGAWCEDYTAKHPIEPYALSGYFRLQLGDDDAVRCGEGREHRNQYCYLFAPCSPPDACEAANVCSKGYTGQKCGKCCDVSQEKLRDEFGDLRKNPECYDDSNGDQYLYYRAYGECVVCPANQILLICLVVIAVASAGGLGYLCKRRRVDISVLAIGVDYVQVLSVFASTEVRWPKALRELYRAMAIFNLDFLDIFPPECSVAISYFNSWVLIEFAPIVLFACCWVGYCLVYVYTMWKFKYKKKEMRKAMKRLWGQLNSTLLYGFYFVYLLIAENTLDVLNCSKIESEDGVESKERYLVSDPTEVCWVAGSTQQQLAPVAIFFVFFYVIGYPALLARILYPVTTRSLILDDQLLRVQGKGGYEEGLSPRLEQIAMCRTRLGLVYYRFMPDVPFWIVVVVLRKMMLAITTSLFNSSASFQLAILLLILFISLVLQMRNLPYSSPATYNSTLTRWADRKLVLDDEEKACTKIRDQAMVRARRKIVNMGAMDYVPHSLAEKAATFFFEYNTVEGFLLSCSVLICLFGTMLDSEYLDNGKHSYYRSILVIMTILVITCSMTYFLIVVWHEIISVLFPALKLRCVDTFSDGVKKDRRDSSADDLDANMEMNDTNPTFNKAIVSSDDHSYMTVEEQLKMRGLLLQSQEEVSRLKRELSKSHQGKELHVKDTSSRRKKKKDPFALSNPDEPRKVGGPLAAEAEALAEQKSTFSAFNPLNFRRKQ